MMRCGSFLAGYTGDSKLPSLASLVISLEISLCSVALTLQATKNTKSRNCIVIIK